MSAGEHEPANGRADEITRIVDRFRVAAPVDAAKTLEFKDLMRERISNILLVSSVYDYYTLVEDGQLSEAIFNEFLELNLLYAPHIVRAGSGEEAFALLRQQSIDLVITMLRIGDMDLGAFCDTVRKDHPGLPIVLLSSQSRELQIVLAERDALMVDHVFIWSGDRKIFLAIIKLIEDLRNAPVDCLEFGTRAIILLEDNPSFYSSYLPLMYTELIRQGQSLIEEGRNVADRLLRQRARPKILHALSAETAWEYVETYAPTLLGIISDVNVLQDGVVTPGAGFAFARRVRAAFPDLPILLQTANVEANDEVERERIAFVNKHSRTLFQEVGDFITRNFGFGDFVFSLPDGTEVSRARNLRDLREKLRYIPEESLFYHASRDHFSNWLMARTHFALARRIKPVKIGQFKNGDALRDYLIQEISQQIATDQRGVIADFSRGDYDAEATISRIGGGSLGGKARGLAFIDSVLKRYLEPNAFHGVTISVPRSIVLGTDVFARFLDMNDLLPTAVANLPDEQILRAFLHADLPPTVLGDLRAILQKVRFPLAVRSSSLLEDALYQPFAGIYSTVMIPNSNPDFSVRFHNLTQAIKYVYASTYFRSAKNYIEATGNRVEEERMAVIVQEMAGEANGRYFYPHISGVARSYNYYPYGKARPKDGVANFALGLGKTIVDGGVSLQFCPKYPAVHPQFTSAKDYFVNSQTRFWALDLHSDIVRKSPTEEDYLVDLGIQDAEGHGTLAYIASTYSRENDALYEGIHRAGPRVLNFAPILKSRIVPVTDILHLLLGMCETAMNCPVEIEFAVRLGRDNGLPAEFRFLQVRPMVKLESGTRMDVDRYPRDVLLYRSEHALGNGRHIVHDVVYVRPEAFDVLKTRQMAREIAQLNATLAREQRPYLLIGPGRWGSADPSLGIPVKFPDISGALAIVETSLPGMIVDPSQGAHFFQNLTSFRIFYFTLRHYDAEDAIDWDWLESHRVVSETEFVRHVRVECAIEIVVDGQSGKGVAAKGASGADPDRASAA